ncbi:MULTISPECIES: hypothetical protein [unclassified Desulfovibrio]|uniref:hypothetical protein n=1 Tax=unclassified Desulfovibrio TaxID=2593640 RepID=UPI00163A091F|nr:MULTISPECIES: hypothetical protein [unclassified Desulfovibrio]
MSASGYFFVKPWRLLRAAFARAETEKKPPSLPCGEFRHFLAAWREFQTVLNGGAAKDCLPAALACVDALAPLDATPCRILRERLAAWHSAGGCEGREPLARTFLPEAVEGGAEQCITPHDVAAFCHERAVGHMLGKAAEQAGGRQLRDGVPKQFWAVNLADAFDADTPGRSIDVGDILSRPMQALWQGMNVLPWQGPPALNGRGFLSVLFEATANPQLDPASERALFFEKNHFFLSREYCHMHSRFGFHTVNVEARLGALPQENHLLFQLRGGAANLERRMLRTRLVADVLAPFGFTAELNHDAVCARRGNVDIEEGERLAAVMGYVAIHTRQLDMIMQDAPQVAARRAAMLEHCRALYAGQALF